MTTVREDFGQGPDGTGEGGPGQPAAETPQPRALRRWHPLASLIGLVRRHWLFSLALVAAAVPRLVVMLGFRPAMLFRLDTFDYLWGAVHLSPNVVNPSGYSLFLWLLLPFHSLVLVAAIQHLLGLGVATMVYAVLRHYRLPAWGATLAAVPVLFDPEQIMIEHLIMADLLAMALMVGSFAVLLFRDSPSLPRSATAGLMMGAATVIRPTVLPLVLLIPVYLLIRRVGWRRAGAALAAGVLPVLGYMSWFAAVNGNFNLSNSNGLFLWSRTMSFANCSVIKPPPDLQALCPTAQPGPLAKADPALRRLPKRYLWNHRIWAWQGTTSGFVPDTAAFTQANNARALRFAILAIKAQPVAYAQAIADGVRHAVRAHRQHAAVPRGPAELVHPDPRVQPPVRDRDDQGVYRQRPGSLTVSGLPLRDPGGARARRPHERVPAHHLPARPGVRPGRPDRAGRDHHPEPQIVARDLPLGLGHHHHGAADG